MIKDLLIICNNKLTHLEYSNYLKSLGFEVFSTTEDLEVDEKLTLEEKTIEKSKKYYKRYGIPTIVIETEINNSNNLFDGNENALIIVAIYSGINNKIFKTTKLLYDSNKIKKLIGKTIDEFNNYKRDSKRIIKSSTNNFNRSLAPKRVLLRQKSF